MGGTPLVDRVDLRTVGSEWAEREKSCDRPVAAYLRVDEGEHHHFAFAW